MISLQTKILLPSFAATLVTAPLMYFLTRLLASKFGQEQNENLDEAVEDAVDKANEERKRRRVLNVDKNNKYIKDLEKKNTKKQ